MNFGYFLQVIAFLLFFISIIIWYQGVKNNKNLLVFLKTATQSEKLLSLALLIMIVGVCIYLFGMGYEIKLLSEQ